MTQEKRAQKGTVVCSKGLLLDYSSSGLDIIEVLVLLLGLIY